MFMLHCLECNTDVDGTLLNSSQELTQLTEDAVKAAALVGVPTIVATGKVT